VEVDLVVDDIADDGFVRAIIADVARRLQEEAAFAPLHGELREQRHDLEHLPWLEQQLRVIGGIAHRRHDRQLPIARAGIDDDVHDLAQLRQRARVDGGVDGRGQAMGPDAAQRRQRELERSGHAPNPVMGRADAIDRDADTTEPRGGSARDALLGQVAV
jgi:hypothetical protein